MPFSFTLHLIAPSPHTPLPTGQQVRGLVYELLRVGDPAVAEAVHALSEHKPFTVSPLRRAKVDDGASRLRRSLRVAALTTDVAVALLRGVAAAQEGAGTLRLGADEYSLNCGAGVIRGQREMGYDDLAEAPPAPAAQLLVTSPAAFRAGPRMVPLPLPEPTVKSLAAKWNTFSSADPLAEADIDAICSSVVVARHGIRTARLQLGDRHEVGFVGRVLMQLHDDDMARRSVFARLMAFSEFAGIGARCTLGMGQTRLLGIE